MAQIITFLGREERLILTCLREISRVRREAGPAAIDDLRAAPAVALGGRSDAVARADAVVSEAIVFEHRLGAEGLAPDWSPASRADASDPEIEILDLVRMAQASRASLERALRAMTVVRVEEAADAFVAFAARLVLAGVILPHRNGLRANAPDGGADGSRPEATPPAFPRGIISRLLRGAI
jgi:hypothetical protein